MAKKGQKTYAIRFLFQTSSGAASRIVETMDDEGLMGPDHSIDMTLKFPPESRWNG